MRWRRSHPGPPPPEPRHEPDTEALAEAHEAFESALSSWPEVHDVTTRMRKLRRENHLAEKVSHAYKEHP